jgi:hypothetical protein
MLLFFKAIDESSFCACLKNVYRSMKHDIIMIVSSWKYYRDGRKSVISEYFDIVEEGPSCPILFKGSSYSDNLLCLRLSRRLDCPHYVQAAPSHRLIDFGNPENEYDLVRRDWHAILHDRLLTIDNVERNARSIKKARTNR